ncbi:hypothetical protein BH10PSE13_BH10PSE13_22830 [soil metagenome]
MLYRVEPGVAWLAHDLGPMTLLYHRRSGITHMVSEPVPQILDALKMIGPADAGAVTRFLGASFDLTSEDEACAAVAARLEELAALGLIRIEVA